MQKIDREIFSLAIPNILSNLSIPLLGMVDLALMGHLDDVKYLAALAVGGMVFNFIYFGFGFLRMSSTGLAAQAYGAGNTSENARIFNNFSWIAIGTALTLLLLQLPILTFARYFVKVDEAVGQLLSNYFYIRIWAAPATLFILVGKGWLLGNQNARTPLFVTILVNISNIFLSYSLVKYFDMGIVGVALGTVIAQYLGLVYLVRHFNAIPLLKAGGRKLLEFSRFDVKLTELVSNLNILLRSLCLLFTFSFFTAQSSIYGATLLAVNTVLMQFIEVLSYALDGFANAAESLIGKFYGAKDVMGFRQSIKRSFYWATMVSIGIAFGFYFFSTGLVRLFTDLPEVLTMAEIYLPWVLLAPIINPFAYIWDGIYIGKNATKGMRDTMVISLLVFLTSYYLLAPIWQAHALWLALLIFMAVRALTLWVFAKKQIYDWVV